MLDYVHTKTCRRLGSSSTLKPCPSPRRRPKQSPYPPYSPVAFSTQQTPFLHVAPPSSLPSQNDPSIWHQRWLCSWILNYSCGSWHWLAPTALAAGRAVGEQEAHSTKKPLVSIPDVPPTHWKRFPKVKSTLVYRAPRVQAPISSQRHWWVSRWRHSSLPASTCRPMQNGSQQPQMLPTHTALCRGMPAQPWVLSFRGLWSSDLLSTSAQQTLTFYVHSNRNLLLPWWFPKDRCFNIAPNNFLLWDREWKAQAAISKHWQGKQTCL